MTQDNTKAKGWLGAATVASGLGVLLSTAPLLVDPSSSAQAAHEGRAIKSGSQPRSSASTMCRGLGNRACPVLVSTAMPANPASPSAAVTGPGSPSE